MTRRPDLRTGVALGLAAVTAGVCWWAFQGGGNDEPHVVIEGVGDTSSRPTAPDVAGQRLPADVTVYAADGTPRTMASLAGTPLVINVWASTCLPCRDEMPALAAFATAFDGRVEVVGINPLDGAGELQAFTDEVGVQYPQYRDPDGQMLVAFGITDLPVTLLVHADGTVAWVHLGALDEGELTSLVASELDVR